MPRTWGRIVKLEALLLLLIALAAAACDGGGGGAVLDAGADGDTDGDTDTDSDGDSDGDGGLHQQIEAKMEEGHLPGLAACVVVDGTIPWCNGYGYANFDEGVLVTEETPFLLASVSKTITATALMQLWESDLLALDDDVNDVLGFPVANPDHPSATITYEQLLTHTSGIVDNWDVMEDNFYFYDEDPGISLGDACAGYLTPGGDYYEPENYASWEPGTDADYSNMAVALLAHTLEVHTGDDFADYCDEHVLEPLEMTNSSWRLEDFDPAELAMPYWWNGSTYLPEGHYTFADYPDGGLRASAWDMARFVLAYTLGGTLDDVEILAPETVTSMLTEQATDVTAGQGLIWALFERDGDQWAGHEGAELGVATAISFRVEDGLGVVLLMNGDWPSPETPVYEIQDRLIEHAESLQE